MSRVAYYDRVELILDDQPRRREADGALIVRARFARTGTQSYSNGDGTSRVEQRDEDEVRRSAPTFEGITLTDLHPARDMITPETWQDHARGHLQSVEYRNGWLEGDAYIMAGYLANAVLKGDRRELSAGYYASHDETPGVNDDGEAYDLRQTEITGNHVAALPMGTARAGPGARLLFDSAQQTPRPPAGGRGDTRMDEFELIIDGRVVRFQADRAAGEAITAELSRMRDAEPRATELEVERDQQQARADAAESRVSDLEGALAEASNPATLDDRIQLIEQARSIAGADLPLTRTDGDATVALSDEDLRRAALTAAGQDLEGRSDAYVEAAFDLAVKARADGSGQTVLDAAEVITGNATGGGSSADPMTPLRDAMLRRPAPVEA